MWDFVGFRGVSTRASVFYFMSAAEAWERIANLVRDGPSLYGSKLERRQPSQPEKRVGSGALVGKRRRIAERVFVALGPRARVEEDVHFAALHGHGEALAKVAPDAAHEARHEGDEPAR